MLRRRDFWKMPVTLAALGLAFALVFMGCDTGSPAARGSAPGPAFLGSTMTLGGQVWAVDWDEYEGQIWELFTGTRTVTAGSWYWSDECCCYDEWIELGGSGSIANGQLGFTIGTPPSLRDVADVFLWGEGEFIDNFTVSPPAARSNVLQGFRTSGGGYSGNLFKDSEWTFTNNTWIGYYVDFVYVDREVTISGASTAEIWECDCDYCCIERGNDYCYCGGKGTIQAFSITLRAGWNAVHFRFVEHDSVYGWVENITVGLGTPVHLRWALHEWSGYSHAFSKALERSGRALPGRAAPPSTRLSLRARR